MRKRLLAIGRALAETRNPRNSVTGRLMVLVLGTTAIALAVAGAALLFTDLQQNRDRWADDLYIEAGIMAFATAPALSFNDQSTAVRNLSAVQARESILAAGLYLPTGELYASYTRSTQTSVPVQQPQLTEGAHINGEQIRLLRAIRQNDETLGFIYLEGRYDSTERVKAYAGILSVVFVLSLGVALLASGWFQRIITEPMSSIAAAARNVIDSRNYSTRAKKTTSDEIGVVVDAFNKMLDEVESRTVALERSNAALQEQVKVRHAAEQALRGSERLYRAIGESIQYGVWVTDVTGRCTYASDSFLKLLGMTQQECSEFGWVQALHPDERDATMTAWRECVRAGGTWYREHRVRGVDGRYHHLLAQGVPIRGDDGQINGWAGINLDISRLKLTEEALREADRRKDEFLATLAHELRNPLAPIRTAVQLLEIQTTNEQQRRWGREVIARQVRNMALLLDDLLDVSRITRGRLELKRQFVDLQSIIDVGIETARPLIETKRHSLSVITPREQLIVEADPLRLSQVLGNLLTNAAKYTDQGGQISLTVAVEEGGLELRVKDSGIGLSPDSIPKLFTMFSQVTSAIDRAQGGLGIGLSLVKGLVDLHGGSVEGRSEGLGRGSEFIVRLPAAIIVAHRTHESRADSGAEEAVRSGLGKVLVVDDNREAAQMLGAVLALAGYEASTAFSGAEALALGSQARPHAVLLDIGMPDMNGYEVARRIRLEAWGRDVLLVAITGWGQEDDKQKAKSMGFDIHLTKPVDPKEVEKILSDRLGGRRGGQSRFSAALETPTE